MVRPPQDPPPPARWPLSGVGPRGDIPRSEIEVLQAPRLAAAGGGPGSAGARMVRWSPALAA
ncbi:hypothetical protein, partial [Phenylobacterium aquaticum]|uniref:hypothetical protein n=1 Tax=Phenylobacterium aquaticum TaxID=1763816 RepID=UPI001F5E2985